MPDFRSQAPSRGLTRLQGNQESTQRLTQDAFSLSPDVDAVTKAVLDKKLYAPDLEVPMRDVNMIVTDYMEKFNQDPFYAFSKDGRKAAQQLKSIVNHPAIREWEQNTAMTDEAYKRASADRLNKNIVVNGNDVLVFKDGQRQYIPLSELGTLDPRKGDRALDIDADMQGIRSKWGVRQGAPTYDMTKMEDVDNKIRNALTGLGSTDTQRQLLGSPQEGVDQVLHNKSNEQQLRVAIRTLATTGLTQSDKNTLKSEYIKEVGNGASNKGFGTWLSDKLSGIASGKLDTASSNTLKKGVKLDVEQARADIDSKNPKLTAASLIFNGVTGDRQVETKVGNAYEKLHGYKLPVQETLSKSSGTMKDDLGNAYPNRTVKDLTFFSDATNLANLSILDRSANSNGSWIKNPTLAQHGVVNDRPGSEPAIVFQNTYKDANGQPTVVPVAISNEIESRKLSGKPIPESLQKYMTRVSLGEAQQDIMRSSASNEDKQRQLDDLQRNKLPDGTVVYMEKKPWVDFSMIIPRKRGWYSNLPNEVKGLADTIDKAGYQSVESDEMADYYKKYSGRPDVTDKPGSFGVDDEYYEVKGRVPVTSFEQMNSVYGGASIGNREDVHISTSKLRDNYELMAPGLFDKTSLPNMVTPPTLMQLDQIK